MGKYFKLLLLFLGCLWLCGCKSKPVQPTAPVLVTQVDIHAQHQGQMASYHYLDARKMEAVLYYLRTLENLGPAKTDPERIIGDSYRIDVIFSDGSRRIYRQQANRFLSRNSRPWHRINAGRAALLYPLLESMPSDPDQPAFSSWAVRVWYCAYCTRATS